MGEMCAGRGEFSWAAEDWLCSADAFLQASDGKRAGQALRKAQELERQGSLPPDRPDLRVALPEREEGLSGLEERIQAFRLAVETHGFSLAVPSEAALDFLLKQRRDLPGLADLHAMIARQADGLGKHKLACDHLRWAATFDSLNESSIAQALLKTVASGGPATAS
jgi:hypothetical protein